MSSLKQCVDDDPEFKRILMDIPDTPRCPFCGGPNAVQKRLGFNVVMVLCKWCDERIEKNMMDCLNSLRDYAQRRRDHIILMALTDDTRR